MAAVFYIERVMCVLALTITAAAVNLGSSMQNTVNQSDVITISPAELHCVAAVVYNKSSTATLAEKYITVHLALADAKQRGSMTCNLRSVDTGSVQWAESMRIAFEVLQQQHSNN